MLYQIVIPFEIFREVLKKDNSVELLFEAVVDSLRQQGIIANKGSIVDATIVQAPIQRNLRSENDDIKQGKTPDDWKDKKSSQGYRR